MLSKLKNVFNALLSIPWGSIPLSIHLGSVFLVGLAGLYLLVAEGYCFTVVKARLKWFLSAPTVGAYIFRAALGAFSVFSFFIGEIASTMRKSFYANVSTSGIHKDYMGQLTPELSAKIKACGKGQPIPQNLVDEAIEELKPLLEHELWLMVVFNGIVSAALLIWFACLLNYYLKGDYKDMKKTAGIINSMFLGSGIVVICFIPLMTVALLLFYHFAPPLFVKSVLGSSLMLFLCILFIINGDTSPHEVKGPKYPEWDKQYQAAFLLSGLFVMVIFSLCMGFSLAGIVETILQLSPWSK